MRMSVFLFYLVYFLVLMLEYLDLIEFSCYFGLDLIIFFYWVFFFKFLGVLVFIDYRFWGVYIVHYIVGYFVV